MRNDVAQFLEAAKSIPHSGKTLFEHLKGTAQILQKAGMKDHVVNAGYFHSAYGTEFFSNVPRIQPHQLIAEIGRHAERLVDFFCNARRVESFLDYEASSIPRLIMRNDTHIMVDSQTMRELRAIEIANMLEMNCAIPSYLADSNVWKHNIVHLMTDNPTYSGTVSTQRKYDAYDLPYGPYAKVVQ